MMQHIVAERDDASGSSVQAYKRSETPRTRKVPAEKAKIRLCGFCPSCITRVLHQYMKSYRGFRDGSARWARDDDNVLITPKTNKQTFTRITPRGETLRWAHPSIRIAALQ
jgi:hypothetical protein